MSSEEDEEPLTSLSDAEVEALHSVELGIERLHRAHGQLIAFHHDTGRAMDHLSDAEEQFREAGHGDFADAIRDEYLPRGVTQGRGSDDRGRWSYDVLETYEDVFLEDLVAFGEEVSESIADGRRHVHERRQEAAWKRRSKRD